MRPCRALGELQSKSYSRMVRLKSIIDYAQRSDPPELRRCLSYVIIEAHSLWASFSRSFFLSAGLGAKRRTGNRVSHCVPFSTTDDLLRWAISKLMPNKRIGISIKPLDEPPWHHPDKIVRLFNEMSASNYGQVQAAAGLPLEFFQWLPKARNYYAHKSYASYLQCVDVARNYRVGNFSRPEEIFMARIGMHPDPLISVWLSEMEIMIDEITK